MKKKKRQQPNLEALLKKKKGKNKNGRTPEGRHKNEKNCEIAWSGKEARRQKEHQLRKSVAASYGEKKKGPVRMHEASHLHIVTRKLRKEGSDD